MKQQNYKNHIRFNILHHFAIIPVTVGLFIWTLISLFKAELVEEQQIFNVILTFVLILISLSARMHGLKNQDRLIRLEMRQRYYELTGQSFKGKEDQLRVSQIIALRFAPDQELVDLIDDAIKNNSSSKAIKLKIKDWQADHMRV